MAAFGSLDHFTRTMVREGIDRIRTPASMNRIHDAMLREQGLESNSTQIWLRSCAGCNAWEVYLCLLLAEVESYRSMRGSFASSPLDQLIDRNEPALDALRTLRDKLLHPVKDVSYDETVARFFREAERRYPSHFLLAKHLQTLLDQYLGNLKEHLANAFADELARLPDNQLHAFLTEEERDRRHGLARAQNASDENATEAGTSLLQDHDKFVRDLRVDPARRNDPLGIEQMKQVRHLRSVITSLRVSPLPTIAYHSPEAVQAPIHEALHSWVPRTFVTDSDGIRGSLLPRPLRRTRPDYVTLVFRSALLFNECLHHSEAYVRNLFPGKSPGEIMEFPDWQARATVASTPDELSALKKETSPGAVALAMLADPVANYQRIVSATPKLSLARLRDVVTGESAARLSAWRNTVFHVSSRKVGEAVRLERKVLDTSLLENYPDLVSGLWQFFFSGDQLGDSVKER